MKIRTLEKYAAAAPVLFLWLWTWKHLAIDWQANEQYQYAWVVPLAFLFTAWRAWAGPHRPELFWGRLLSFAVLPVFIFAELMRVHDPFWRMSGALLMGASTLLTLGYLLAAGGKPLLLRQTGPLLIAWTALPWPWVYESWVTQVLLHFVTGCVSNLMNLLGYDAIQNGNLIVLSHGCVGMGDACSGIRSLQAGLMVALLIAEFEAVSLSRRVVLVVLAVLTAVAVNVLRVLSLALITQGAGEGAAVFFHDTAGWMATLLMVAMIYGLGMLAATGSSRRCAEGRPPFFVSMGGLGCVLAFLLLLVPVAVQIATGLGGEKAVPATAQWRLQVSDLPAGWQAAPFAERKEEWRQLRYSSSEAWKLSAADGSKIYLIHLYWKVGNRMPGMAFYHTPAVCMPSVGWMQDGEPVTTRLQLGGVEVPGKSYRFRQFNREILALQVIASGGEADFSAVAAAHPADGAGRWNRLAVLWRSPRRLIDEELLIYVAGPVSENAGRWQELIGAVVRPAGL